MFSTRNIPNFATNVKHGCVHGTTSIAMYTMCTQWDRVKCWEVNWAWLDAVERSCFCWLSARTLLSQFLIAFFTKLRCISSDLQALLLCLGRTQMWQRQPFNIDMAWIKLQFLTFHMNISINWHDMWSMSLTSQTTAHPWNHGDLPSKNDNDSICIPYSSSTNNQRKSTSWTLFSS